LPECRWAAARVSLAVDPIDRHDQGGIMKFLRPFLFAACAQAALATPLAMAQTTPSGQDPNAAQQGTQSGQQAPGTTMRYADPSHKASSAPEGTLMQKREQGMSPQGASGASGTSTGKIPQ